MRCLDDDGKLRIFPVNITNLYITDIKNSLGGGGCEASVDDLISLKELVDALKMSR